MAECVNTTVAQVRAQLENAEWEFSQTSIRAPADGFVTVMALTVGDRALRARSVMSFIVETGITIFGMFAQNGFQTIRFGAPASIVFDNAPGRIYHAKITAIPMADFTGRVGCWAFGIAAQQILQRFRQIEKPRQLPAGVS